MGICHYCQKSAGIFKNLHKDCEAKHSIGKTIISQKSMSFFDQTEIVEIDSLEKIADDSFISYGELENIMEKSFTFTLLSFLDDGLLDDNEEESLKSA